MQKLSFISPNMSHYPHPQSQVFSTRNLLIKKVSHTSVRNDGSKLPFLAQKMKQTQHNITHKPLWYSEKNQVYLYSILIQILWCLCSILLVWLLINCGSGCICNSKVLFWCIQRAGQKETQRNGTFEFHMQPLPQFINSTSFTTQQSTVLCNFIMVIFYNFSKCNIRAPWRWRRERNMWERL